MISRGATHCQLLTVSQERPPSAVWQRKALAAFCTFLDPLPNFGDGDLPHWQTTPLYRREVPATRRAGLMLVQDTHHKLAVDLLKNLLLIERHGLPFPLFYPLLLQALAGIHFTCGPNLAGTDLRDEKVTKVTEALQWSAGAPPCSGCIRATAH